MIFVHCLDKLATCSQNNRKLKVKWLLLSLVLVKAKVKVDAIDVLLQDPKDHSKRVYQGFHLDEDVLRIIDRVSNRYKSELVNEAL